MLIKRTSILSRKEHEREIDISPIQLATIANRRGPIQDVAPYLSADDREFLMTGITPEEWDALMGTEDE